MNTTNTFAKWVASCGLMFMALGAQSQVLNYHPERLGVIDITPTDLSGESLQNSEPSLGVGLGASYGRMVVHAFTHPPFSADTLYNNYYASQNLGQPPWLSPGTLSDFDATLDWSLLGTCYAAVIPTVRTISVLKTTDPASVPFASIPGSAITRGSAEHFPDQPWVRVVNVANDDHIFVAFNDLSQISRGSTRTATIRYSMDSGGTWLESVIDQGNPGVGDSPAVRLALSPDGRRAYALFQRLNGRVNGAGSPDSYIGQVVVVRDDHYGASGFRDLGDGTLVESLVSLPAGTSLGIQRLGSDCDIAIDPADSSRVYAAYTVNSNGVPILRVAYSANSGANFNLVYSIPNASIPALAVNWGSTVGLLYARLNGTDLEVHFLKASRGFGIARGITDRILAKFPNNNPPRTWYPYIGDYFTLRAINYNFYGTFCASGDPKPDHFPSGVYFQRNVKIDGTVYSQFWLTAPGTLANLSGGYVPPSIDPFVFYDITPDSRLSPVPPDLFNPTDPLNGVWHLRWPVLSGQEPQFQLQTSSQLGQSANWALNTNSTIIQSEGQFVATFLGSQPQQFYRLERSLDNSQFNLFVASGAGGSIYPNGTNGIITLSAGGNQTFAATPSNNYAVSKWYLDGVVVQSNSPLITLSNITTEHTLVATFAPSNDLAVTVAELAGDEGPGVPDSTNRYVIGVENKGLEPLSNIALTNYLPAGVDFISATNSGGTVTFQGGGAGGKVAASMAGLNSGQTETVTIWFVPTVAEVMTNTVTAACSVPEPDLSNNFAIDITKIIDPVVITNPPIPQVVAKGGTASFTVGASGTPPIAYQWFFNATNTLAGATNSTLTLQNVGANQAGSYSASVYQILGPEGIVGDDSSPATLTVQ